MKLVSSTDWRGIEFPNDPDSIRFFDGYLISSGKNLVKPSQSQFYAHYKSWEVKNCFSNSLEQCS